MKKVLLSILTVIYMAATCGIAMEVHYCMGKQAGVEFYGSKTDKCGKCGMTEKKDGCCKDEHQFYKLSDSHKNVLNDIDYSYIEFPVFYTYSLYNWQIADKETTTSKNIHAPPNIGGPSINVRNCVFTI